MTDFNALSTVSPIDGRYERATSPLQEITSERALMRYRVEVEVEWLRTLAGGDVLADVPAFSDEQHATVRALADDFSIQDAARIKEIEGTTKHDVKAVEIWIKEKLGKAGGFDDHLELVHFGCTSEDINNIAYALMLRDARDNVILPAIDDIGQDLEAKAHAYAQIPLLSKTHGQPATPTTLGKEMAVFVERLSASASALGGVAIYGKFNGATGTYGAAEFAYPEVDWQSVNKKFVERFELEFQPVTAQIEPHDYMARMMNELGIVNSQLIDFCRDVWQYISDGVFIQKVVEGEVGSSTMPHKVNPIDFENAEANLGLANAIGLHLAGKLPISRLQRDLSDSSAQRAFGEVFGHSIIALKSLKRGLGKISPDEVATGTALDKQWAILAEPLQTVMRKYRIAGAYDIIKAHSRGDKELTEAAYLAIVEDLDIPEEDKRRLLELTPRTYVGLAPVIASSVKYSREQ